eukprot:1175506-Prorocentrum_minimum.AAC.1
MRNEKEIKKSTSALSYQAEQARRVTSTCVAVRHLGRGAAVDCADRAARSARRDCLGAYSPHVGRHGWRLLDARPPAHPG